MGKNEMTPKTGTAEGLLCLPAQSQGDSRRQTVTLGELDRAVEGQMPIELHGAGQ